METDSRQHRPNRRLAPHLILALLLFTPLALLGADGDALPLPEPNHSVNSAEAFEPVPVTEPSPLAVQYYRTGNWLWTLGELWSIGVLALLLFTGTSAGLRNLARRICGSWFVTVGLYLLFFLAICYVIDFPIHYYRGFVRQHAYGLSNQTFSKWFLDSVKHTLVSAVVAVLFVWVPYLLILRSPRRWWLYATILTVPFLFGVVLLKPIWVDPLFNKFGPMKNQRLEQQILELAERSGIEGSRIYEVNKSQDTKALNAYVTGLFGTKRIVLWDTLLNRLNDREVLVVMGHEMGHYVLGHIPRSILLSTVVTLASLFWVDRAGRWLIARYQGRFGFESLADIASVPLLLLLLQVSSLALGPITNLYSRHQEHEADRFALELTRTNRDAALAFVKLQQANLGVPRPGWYYRLWRGSHPSIGERIDFCNTYRPWMTGEPLRYSRWIRPGSQAD